MTMVLIREGNRYRPEVEMDEHEMPDRVTVETQNGIQFPTHVEIWGAMLNPELGVEMMRFIKEEEEKEKKPNGKIG